MSRAGRPSWAGHKGDQPSRLLEAHSPSATAADEFRATRGAAGLDTTQVAKLFGVSD